MMYSMLFKFVYLQGLHLCKLLWFTQLSTFGNSEFWPVIIDNPGRLQTLKHFNLLETEGSVAKHPVFPGTVREKYTLSAFAPV